MKKIQHYITGQWLEGTDEGIPVFDAITGELIANSAVEGLNIPDALQYGRDKGEALRKMTFQERGNMLKKLAFYLIKKKEVLNLEE